MNENWVSFSKFPAGETHATVNLLTTPLPIYVPIRNGNINDNLMEILLLGSVYKQNNLPVKLFMPYLPYARQDRSTHCYDPFSLKVVGEILNLQKYEKIITLDVHSDVAFACIDNLMNISIDQIISHSSVLNATTLVIPDAGAYKRLKGLSPRFEKTAIAIKERDTATGRLTLKHLTGDVQGETCLIVDDICDGGGTFTQLAPELILRGAKSVHLFVTHGIFSKGFQHLWDAGISTIHTTNSYRNDIPTAPNIEVIDVERIYDAYV